MGCCKCERDETTYLKQQFLLCSRYELSIVQIFLFCMLKFRLHNNNGVGANKRNDDKAVVKGADNRHMELGSNIECVFGEVRLRI